MEATSTPTAVAKSLSKKTIYIGAAVGFLLLAGGVAAALYLSGAFSPKLDASNPAGTASAVNQLIIGAIESLDPKVAASGNLEAFLKPLEVSGGLIGATSAEFEVAIQMESETANADMLFNGKTKTTNGETSAEGNLSLEIDSAELDAPLTTKMDILVANKAFYARLTELDTDLAAIGGEQFEPFLNMLENKWISFDTNTLNTASSFTGETSIDFSETDKQNTLKKLRENLLLINARSTADRTLKGITVKCMLADFNQSAFAESSNIDASSISTVELCTNGANSLPIFVGLSGEDSGSKINISISIFTLNADFTITPPTDAKTIEELFTEALSGVEADINQDYQDMMDTQLEGLENYDYGDGYYGDQ